MVTSKAGAVKLVKIDSDANQQLSAQMGVRSLPTVIAFVGGQPVDGFMGALPSAQVTAFVDKVLSEHSDKLSGGGDAGVPDLSELLGQAAEAMASGDVQGAGAMYSQAFNADPSNLEALAGLGKALLAAGQADAAKELLDSLEDDAKADPQIASLATMVKLADEAADSVAKLAEYQAAVDADDSNLDAKYHLAVALFGAGQRDAGLDQLLPSSNRNAPGTMTQHAKSCWNIWKPLAPRTHSRSTPGKRCQPYCFPNQGAAAAMSGPHRSSAAAHRR